MISYLNEKIRIEQKNYDTDSLQVRMYPIRQYSLLKLDGYYYYLSGSDDAKRVALRDAVPFYLSDLDISYVKCVEKAVQTQFYDREQQGRRVITEEKNIALYDLLMEKLNEGIFLKKKTTIVEMLLEGQETFKKLDLEKQCYIIMQIFAWINSTQNGVNLTYIGGAANAGKLKLSKIVSKLSEAILIEQSTTGLYERKIDLLTV